MNVRTPAVPVPAGPTFCGRCGNTVPAGIKFCGRCGNPVGPIAAAASVPAFYPVVPAVTVPAAHRKLPPRMLILVGGGALLLLVVIITVIALAARPGAPAHCTYACAPPQLGSRQTSASAFHNDHWGYTVDYSSSEFSVAAQDTDSVTLQGGKGITTAIVRAVSGQTPEAAVQAAVSGLDTAKFQDLQPKGGIPGAEVGEVTGSGTYLTGTFVTQGGGTPVAIQIMAATQNNVTIVVTLVDSPSQGNTVTGISSSALDYVVSELLWPGSS